MVRPAVIGRETAVSPVANAGSGRPEAARPARSFAGDNAFLLATAAISFFVFISLLADVLLKGGFFGIDGSVHSRALSFWGAQLKSAMIFIGLVFDPYCIAAVMLAAAVYLWFKDSRRDSLMFLFLVILSGALIETFKFLVQRGRPPDMLTGETGYSFPSGHATMAVALFGTLIYMAYLKGIARPKRRVIIVTSIFMILLIGFDRIYLNVHWASDVIGGFALGTLIVSGALLLRAARDAWGNRPAQITAGL
jgi:membrane-associated phospholipid phosphatase